MLVAAQHPQQRAQLEKVQGCVQGRWLALPIHFLRFITVPPSRGSPAWLRLAFQLL